MITETLSRKALLARFAALAALMADPLGILKAFAQDEGPGNFAKVYGDERERDRFYWFLQVVFRLHPEDEFQQLIIDLNSELKSDKEIYLALLKKLPGIRPTLAPLTYDLPALRAQKHELSRQTLEFIGDKPVDGYLEIGSPARYVSDLRKRLRFTGKIWIVNDYEPSYSPVDVMERGRLRKLGAYLPLGNYEPIPAEVASESLDLVTNFIGFHHCPPEMLAGFIAGIRRVLRPGGRLLLRDHDAPNAKQSAFVALAHDVFNAGVGLSWPDNHAQLRHFKAMKDWTSILVKAGFTRRDKLLAQDHDPTDNLLAEFTKV